MWPLNIVSSLTLLLCSLITISCTSLDDQLIDEQASETQIEDSSNQVQLESSQQAVRYGANDGDQHPSVVKLIMRTSRGYSLCSGSVISEDAVLTAAHCVDNVSNAANVYMILGADQISAAEIIIHPEYSASTPHVRYTAGDYYRFSGADIALLKFDNLIPVPSIDLGEKPSQRGELLTIVGYGNNEHLSNGIRRNGTVEYVGTTATYLIDKNTVDQAEGSIIIDPGPTHQTVCGGDSGGALLHQGALIGVTSGGVINAGSSNQCVRSRNANFISVSAYTQWISEHVDLPGDKDQDNDDDSGDENSGDEDSGDEDSGDEDSGDEDSGDEDSGDEDNGDEDNGDEDNGDEDNGDEDQRASMGEYGQATVSHEWSTIQLDGTYQDPVVIVSDPHTNETIAMTTRLRNVQASSFEIKLQQPNYLGSPSLESTVHYLVVESGEWTIENGIKISAGHFASNKLSRQGWSRVHLDHFQNTPSVLTQVQSSNGGDWVVTRTRRHTPQSFDVTMQEEEALNSGDHARETLGWVAISQGRVASNSLLMESRASGRQYHHRLNDVETEFDVSESTLLVKLASTFGHDTALAKVQAKSAAGFSVQVAEEQSRDRELNHTHEAITYLAFGEAYGRLYSDEDSDVDPPADRSFGEFGMVTVSRAWQTVMFKNAYTSPIVVVSDPTAQSGVAMSIRLRNVNPQSFELKIVAPQGYEGTVAQDQVSFMVVEEGEWTSSTGAQIKAGKLGSNKLSRQGWERVRFDQALQAPVAFTQVQSSAESGWLVTRVKQQNRNGFKLTMQEAELEQRRGSHATESIGWIAIDEGDHSQSTRLLSTTTARAVNHQAAQINFHQSFESAPLILAKMGSSFGGDSSNVSLSEVSPSGCVVQIAEEQSRDQETRHIPEKVSLFALSDLSGSLYLND